MKVFGTTIASCFKGKGGATVYYPSPGRNYSIARKYVTPTITANNHLRGNQMKNLALVWKSARSQYKADYAAYLALYRQEHPVTNETDQNPNNAFALFIKACFKWNKQNPIENDLAMVTAEDIIDKNIALKSVKDSVDAAYLLPVSDYATLDELIATA